MARELPIQHERFAWRFFLAGVVGLVLIIAVICTLANVFKKKPAAALEPPAFSPEMVGQA